MNARDTSNEAAGRRPERCDRILPLGEPASYRLAAGERVELLQLAGNAPVIELVALAAVDVRTFDCTTWSTIGRLERETIRLRLDPQQRIAVEAVAGPAAINVSPAPARRLLVDRVYGGSRRGRTRIPSRPVPGEVLQLLIDVIDVEEGESLPSDPPRVSFVYADPAITPARIELQSRTGDAGLFAAAGVAAGDRRVVDIMIPEDAQPGFGRLIIDNGGDLYLDGVEFEIADPAVVKLRNRLLRRSAALAARYMPVQPAVIGPWSPLPDGAELCEALTGKRIASGFDADTFLFFAFDPQSRFEQKRTLWILANWRTKSVQLFDRTVWPNVMIPGDGADDGDDGITCRGSRAGPDFGSPDVQRNQFFGGVLFQDGAPVAPPRPRVPRRAPASPLAGLSFLGGTAANCPRVTKVAILVQLDDNTTPQNRNGQQIPNFDDVMKRERALVQALGFDQVFELKPDDFITRYSSTGIPQFQRPTLSNAGSLQPLLDRVDNAVRNNPDCCTEIVIFINSHQSREAYLRYRNRDVPRRNDPKNRKVDVEESISQAILCRLIAEQVQRSTAAAGLRCQPPTEIIFHTCFSGRFANSDFDKANDAGIGITASSGGRETTKGKRNGGAATTDEYFFLDALEECVRANPDRPLTDIFDCIRDATRRRSDGTQTPVRKPPTRP
jgi:hypothetical protein